MAGFLSLFSPSKSKSTTKSTPRHVQVHSPRTPMSLPRWEVIREPPPSGSSTIRGPTPAPTPTVNPTRSKRKIDELQDHSVPVTPSKKRAPTPAPVASSSRTRLDPFQIRAQPYKTPPASTRTCLASKPSASCMRSCHAANNESPCSHRTAQALLPEAKRVGIIDLTQETEGSEQDSDAPRVSKPSAKALGKRKENPSCEETGPSRKQGDEAPVPVKKKRKRASALAEPTSQRSTQRSKPRLPETKSVMTSKRPTEPTPVANASAQKTSESIKRKLRLRIRNRNKRRKAAIAQSMGRGVTRQDALPSPPPESFGDDSESSSDETFADDEEDEWLTRTARELKLDEDHIRILKRIRDEPDDKKFLFAIGSQMSREWKVPKETKSKLTALTQELLLGFKWPTVFKDRHFNIYRLLGNIKSKPRRIGLDKSWVDNSLKFYVLQTVTLGEFSTARHKIKEKIAGSIELQYSIEDLAESLGKEDPCENDLGMLALLYAKRQIYRKNGSYKYFDNVDDELSELHSLSFLDAKRKLRWFLKEDRKEFP